MHLNLFDKWTSLGNLCSAAKMGFNRAIKAHLDLQIPGLAQFKHQAKLLDGD